MADKPVKTGKVTNRLRDRQGKINKQEAIALYKGGMKQIDIANKYGVSRPAISNLIARTEANKEELERYRANKAQIFENIQSELLPALVEKGYKYQMESTKDAILFLIFHKTRRSERHPCHT